ncbi:FtsK/SpoIIIE domain-containing protein, partial [Actinomadura rubrisoli]|uniref:FtsK/SpoIIIE domain-containing protein n=1 Tax=Actinomadura rubrisoli TaxID=2530368 RepID=UPI0014048640
MRGAVNKTLGTIIGPRAARNQLVRTIALSLALNHSPNDVAFAFVGSGGASFVGLGNLPHVAAAHNMSLHMSLIGGLLQALDDERRRRAAIIARVGARTWDEYQAGGDLSFGPLPALIVVLDSAGPLLHSRPDMLEAVVQLCGTAPDTGIRFVFCSSSEADLPAPLLSFARWRVDFGHPAQRYAHLEHVHQMPKRLVCAHIPLEESDPLVERMRERGLRARRLPWPSGPAALPEPPDEPPQPPDEPPQPTSAGVIIGYDAEGRAVRLDPLASAAGGPHGLVVGETGARQDVVRGIVRALAAAYPPAELGIVFAGMGEHPLGDAVELPHRRHAYEELLGRPEELQRFLAFVRHEIDVRAGARRLPAPPPWLLLMVADVSLTFPASRPEAAEALLALAQQGESLGIHLLISSTIVERTTIWARFLPLLNWRIAASPLEPAVCQDVMGRARLPFPGDQRARLALSGDRRARPPS